MTLRATSLITAAIVASFTVTACRESTSSTGAGPAGAAPEAVVVPPPPVAITCPPKGQQVPSELLARIDAVKGRDATSFAAEHCVPFSGELGYDPLAAKGLEKIQASALELSPNERASLGARGFVTSNRKTFPSYAYGYASIFRSDLPIYVSADSILFAVHHSFDKILQGVETTKLITLLTDMLDSMRASLTAGAGADLSADARRDADVYLAVAKGLLRGSFAAPVAAGDATLAQGLYDAATAASGARSVDLFGDPRMEDFSQFKPRGHYTESEDLSRYFRASMWLGRTDLRVVEVQQDHSQRLHRRQLEAAFVLRASMNEAALASWKAIDDAIGAFVGESDNMTLPQLPLLLKDLGIASAAGLAALPDETIKQAILKGGYGAQRISSHMMKNGLGSGTMPLSSTFLILGQRYVLDSHVFSNVVHDRVSHPPAPMRMMPNPLDVAFAALHNDQAGLLLGAELTKYGYAPDIDAMRILADAHPPSYWDENLYTAWLGMLRTLSPTPDVTNPAATGLPRVAGTEAWGRRLLNTQLASWAELRHDTILYAKQSYTGGAECEYPDAYVEPYPEFYARLAAFAVRGAALLGALGLEPRYARYFAQVQQIASTLEVMAKDQRTGAPHSPEHMAFINDLIVRGGCSGGVTGFGGWYGQLFFNQKDVAEPNPLIADVHTQPYDEVGGLVGRVLHVGTGFPRAMVVTVESCAGPRAYVGLVSSYFEKVTENFQRLDDATWSKSLNNANPPDVPWMTDIIVR